jgi:two-component system invasion response regulator UvrY
MIEVLIVDDHAVVREGMKKILSSDDFVKVTGEANDAPSALELVWNNEYDVIVLDISMPGISGLELISQIKDEHPDTPILILSMYPEEQFATRVLKAGAAGYLNKESAPENLVQAVKKVYEGGHYVSPKVAEQLVHTLQGDKDGPPHELLTDREYEVFMRIVNGKELKEIAAELNISVKTVSTYRTRMLNKLELKNNVELALYAVKHNLVEGS